MARAAIDVFGVRLRRPGFGLGKGVGAAFETLRAMSFAKRLNSATSD
jgi:hypothetical protein